MSVREEERRNQVYDVWVEDDQAEFSGAAGSKDDLQLSPPDVQREFAFIESPAVPRPPCIREWRKRDQAMREQDRTIG